MKADKEHQFRKVLAQLEAKDETLKVVKFINYELTDEDIILLVEVLPYTQITTLELGKKGYYKEKDKIGSAAIIALAKALPQTMITSLHLGWELDHVSMKEGLAELARTLPLTQVDNLSLDGRCYNDILAEALPHSKVTTLKLIDKNACSSLAKVLPQSKITNLDIRCYDVTHREFKLLAKALPNTKITRLAIGGSFSSGWEKTAATLDDILAEVLPLTQITELKISMFDREIKLVKLANAIAESQLTSLDLFDLNLGDEGVTELAGILSRCRIKNLDLSSLKESLFIGHKKIGPKGAIELGKGLAGSSVSTLNLRGNAIGDAGAIELAKGLYSCPISILNLSESNIGNVGASALAEVLSSRSIATLNLSNNNIGDEGAIALAKLLPHSEIIELYLNDNQISDIGFTALCKAIPGTKIISFSLAGNKITHEGCAELARVLPQSQIVNLGLHGNQVGPLGAAELAKSGLQAKLTYLGLSACQIGDSGVSALCKILPESTLTSLDLGSNQISDAGAARLATVIPQCKVTKLFLTGNKIGPIGAGELSKVVRRSEIVDINLLRNPIGAVGTEYLFKTLIEPNLHQLKLEDDNIVDAEAFALAKVLPQSQITSLDISSKKLNAVAVAEIVKALPFTNIEILYFNRDTFEDAGVFALIEVLPKTHLTSLYLSGDQIGNNGIAALAHALPGSQISSLNLNSNKKIGSEGYAELAKALPESLVTDLDLSSCNIDDASIAELAKALPFSKISHLKLSLDKKIGPAGYASLAKVLPKSLITELDLCSCEIDDAGITTLAQGLPLSKIKGINFRTNLISEKGAIELAKVLPQTQIVDLTLAFNHIGAVGVAELAKVLPQTQIVKLNLFGNQIGATGAAELGKGLAQSQIAKLDLAGNQIGTTGVIELARGLEKSKITVLDLHYNEIGEVPVELAQFLAQSPIADLNLNSNNISSDGVAVLAEYLPNSRISVLDLRKNQIGDLGITKLAKVLAQTEITSLDLSENQIGDAGVIALAEVLSQTKITQLWLSENQIGDPGIVALAKILPLCKIIGLDLGKNNNISNAGFVALAKALPHSRVQKLSLSYADRTTYGAPIDMEGSSALFEAVKLNCSITEIFKLTLSDEQRSIMSNHLEVNEILNSPQSEDVTVAEYIAELEKVALLCINQTNHLQDPTFEKAKRLLLKAMDHGSIRAMYLLGNLYFELKDLSKAQKYYFAAAANGNLLSKLCLQVIEQHKLQELVIDDLTITLPRRYSLRTAEQKLIVRDKAVAGLSETSSLVCKSGISLLCLNEMQKKWSMMDVFVAKDDYETDVEGGLSFSKGQSIYINHFNNTQEDFATFVKEVLASCFIPYNRGRDGRNRNSVGFIPYNVFIEYLEHKPREKWSAEEICNAVVVPLTAPKKGASGKTYADMLPQERRGKPFEGYILSYARATRFNDVLTSLNERFKDKDPETVFIWMDLACINQHAWMEMKSEDIGKVLEVNLTQLFTHISEGRLIHFDRAKPTNLTRSWCLVELLACLKAQVETVAQTEICMSSDVQNDVLAQDVMELLDALDSSKAQCFNPEDKRAIDAQIIKALTKKDEESISIDIAFARLNNVVKSWLISRFLPDFSVINGFVSESSIEEVAMSAAPVLEPPKPLITRIFEAKRADGGASSASTTKLRRKTQCVIT